MAVQRDNPYGAYNFRVICPFLGEGNGPGAGFQEVTGLGMEVAVLEYREGGDRLNSVRKVFGLSKAADVTLKRGITGSTNLFEWIRAVRDGDANARTTVVIELLDESHTAVVMTWRLRNAWPVKYAGPTLNACGNETAIEELTLTCESIDVE